MKEYFKLKTLIITLSILAASILIGAGFAYLNFNNNNIVLAGTGENVTGFAWSENIGWISFNSLDCDTDANGYIDTDAMVPGCGGDNATTPTFNYGVNVDYQTTGNFSGYAWSSNVGWISFQEGEAPPDNYAFSSNCDTPASCDDITDNCTACYNSTNGYIYGWAKILSLGSDGWIKMRDDSVSAWNGAGVNVSFTTNDFSGWAWNSNGICVGGANDLADCVSDTDCSGGTCEYKAGIGWVSFNCANTGVCATSDYKVHVDIPPDPPTNLTTTPIDCNTMQLNWTDNSSNETGFAAEYTNDGGINWYSFCSVGANIEQCLGTMPENTTYDFRVKALGGGTDSAWEPSSGGVSGSTDYCPPVLTADNSSNCDSVILKWTYGDNDNVTQYEVWKDTNNSGSFSRIATLPPATPNTYTDNDIVSDYQYDYYVVAQSQNSTSNTINDLKPCPSLPTWIEVKP